LGGSEFIDGIVRAGPDAATRYAADFTVQLQRKEVETYSCEGFVELTARWSGGAEFVDMKPSPYLVLVLWDADAEYRILSIRPLAFGKGLLGLTVEPQDSNSSAGLQQVHRSFLLN